MRRSAAFLLSLLSLQAALGDDPPDIEALQALVDDILQVNIVARIIPEDSGLFHVTRSQLTVPGRPIEIRFQGENIYINATLTPYFAENGHLFLVAQGRVWTSSAENVVKYLTSFKSIPVNLGEKVLFFPLGMPEDLASEGFFNIALEIEIVPFKSP